MTHKLAFINANIITMNPNQPHAEAIGLAGEAIIIIGSTAEVQAWAIAEGAEIRDATGQTIVPGLIESHNHISIGSVFSSYANCSSVTCSTIEDVLNSLAESVKKTESGKWVQGVGYDDTAIAEMRHLTRHDLDMLSTEHPIYVTHVSGHLGYLNSMALEMAGITADTPDPDGGTIDKDDKGDPSGLLLENAAFGVRRMIPEPSREEFRQLFIDQIAYFNSVGVTSTHDAAVGMMGDAEELLSICRELEKENRMNVRIYTAVVEDAYNKYDALGVAKGYGSHYFKVGGVKYFQDGSIQGFTGALLDDYHTRPGWRGDLIYPQEVLNEKFVYHQGNGDHIVVHGNGDAAIESILQAFELAQETHPREDTRHMLIHCQMAHDDHITRMKKLGVIPSYFINHVYFWGDRHKNIFIGPERAARIDPLASSLKQGLIFSIHCDFPITPIDPMFIMHTAVNRHTRSGETLGPEERISPLDALRTFTTWAALCSFEEDVKGSLEVGKLADLTIMAEDMLAVPPETIKDIEILATVVGGRIVFEK